MEGPRLSSCITKGPVSFGSNLFGGLSWVRVRVRVRERESFILNHHREPFSSIPFLFPCLGLGLGLGLVLVFLALLFSSFPFSSFSSFHFRVLLAFSGFPSSSYLNSISISIPFHSIPSSFITSLFFLSRERDKEKEKEKERERDNRDEMR